MKTKKSITFSVDEKIIDGVRSLPRTINVSAFVESKLIELLKEKGSVDERK